MVRNAAILTAQAPASAPRCGGQAAPTGGVEEGPAIDALHAVGSPELQRVGGAELDGAERIGDAEEIGREDVWRGLVEAPVGQCDARVDRLKLAFEIEQIGAVPGQKSRLRHGPAASSRGVCMSRKSAKRPAPWLLSCANAATKRSRSPGVSVLAFFRMRTITWTEPTSVVPVRASILTSPLLTLGRPNLPATKNGTEAPVIGTGTVRLLENAPVVLSAGTRPRRR